MPGGRIADSEGPTDRLGPPVMGGRVVPLDGHMTKDGPESTENRLFRLEVEFKHFRNELDEIKAGQKAIIDILTTLRVELADLRAEMTDLQGKISKLPTSQTLFFNTFTVGLFSVAVVGVFIGVLTYLGALPK